MDISTPYTEAPNSITEDIDVCSPNDIVAKLSCCDFEMFNPKLENDDKVCCLQICPKRTISCFKYNL